MKVKFSTGDVDLKERRKQFRKVDKHDDEIFRYDCGRTCEDRIFMVGECPLYENDREICMSGVRKIEGRDREAFECWDCVKKSIYNGPRRRKLA